MEITRSLNTERRIRKRSGWTESMARRLWALSGQTRSGFTIWGETHWSGCGMGWIRRPASELFGAADGAQLVRAQKCRFAGVAGRWPMTMLVSVGCAAQVCRHVHAKFLLRVARADSTVSSEGNPLRVRGKWLGPESNRRHEDFQSSALPTELPSHPPAGRSLYKT